MRTAAVTLILWVAVAVSTFGFAQDAAPATDVRTFTYKKTEQAGKKRPNVVFILTDDQRWDQLGCEGHPFLKTPAVDRLAAEGARFANMFVTTSLCSPSRASFLSGLYAHGHGVVNNFTDYP
ncbi:MAG: sulfatase-like hydrolase/transferase, partial [Candidatus Nealsonbacteria bacterium]|nr:sulfatase-like hydrolase/transferase [Candidatus Nealsonbacteria bacterium]